MATIPNEEKVFMVSNSTNTTYSGSASLKAMQEWYTMQDVIDTVGRGLQGTNYIFVAANGTPEENAIELQTAYELSEDKVDYKIIVTPFIPDSFFYADGFLDLPSEDYVDYGGSPIESWVIYELIFDGVSYFASFDGISWSFVDGLYPPGTGYTTLEILISAATYNLVTVIAAPGKYSFDTDFIVDKEYVSIVSLTGNADVLFTGEGTINVIVNGIFLKGIDVQNKPFTIATDLDLLVVENCVGGQYSFGGDGSTPINISGTFTNCRGGAGAFGSLGTVSGVFTNCVAGQESFGYAGIASGTFNNCIATFSSFGLAGDASGTFTNCIGGDTSFGANGTASGIFNNCIGGTGSFGSYGGNDANSCAANGYFKNCSGGYYSFGTQALASGVFLNCNGEDWSFGGGNSVYAIASGTFNNCIGGVDSFGGQTLSGKLYYCKINSGVFTTVSGGGRTYYCVDGNGNTNNQ